eukprot:COSAG02_NODE_36919_length_448_cov_462.424069_1_plen_90_part_01
MQHTIENQNTCIVAGDADSPKKEDRFFDEDFTNQSISPLASSAHNPSPYRRLKNFCTVVSADCPSVASRLSATLIPELRYASVSCMGLGH